MKIKVYILRQSRQMYYEKHGSKVIKIKVPIL